MAKTSANKKENFWLMKSEPDTYSIDQFKKDKKTLWEGVRNYQARNFMTKEMQVGDLFLFYHSNATPPSVVGIGQISKSAVADPTAFNKNSEYYEPKATKEKPIWECVEVKYIKKFPTPFSLTDIKKETKLKNMVLTQKGSRLSIQPVTKSEFEFIVKHCEHESK